MARVASALVWMETIPLALAVRRKRASISLRGRRRPDAVTPSPTAVFSPASAVSVTVLRFRKASCSTSKSALDAKLTPWNQFGRCLSECGGR